MKTENKNKQYNSVSAVTVCEIELSHAADNAAKNRPTGNIKYHSAVNTSKARDSILQWELIHFAAATGMADIVQQQLDAGVRPDGKHSASCGCISCSTNPAPLALAAYAGHVNVMKILLAAGADVNHSYYCGNNSLTWAAVNGHTEAVRLLLDVPELDVMRTLNCNRWSVLHLAAAAGLTKELKELIATGEYDVNAVDKENRTPLHWAAHNGHADAVRVLLAVEGIKANVQDLQFTTPFAEAVAHGYPEIANMLNPFWIEQNKESTTVTYKYAKLCLA